MSLVSNFKFQPNLFENKIKQLSDGYLRTYNVLDKGHRAVVAGLSTSGEAGFEAYQNLNTSFVTAQYNHTKILRNSYKKTY